MWFTHSIRNREWSHSKWDYRTSIFFLFKLLPGVYKYSKPLKLMALRWVHSCFVIKLKFQKIIGKISIISQRRKIDACYLLSLHFVFFSETLVHESHLSHMTILLNMKFIIFFIVRCVMCCYVKYQCLFKYR